MREKDILKKELEEHAPLLAHLKGRPEGFQVPEQYFQKLSDDIMQQVEPLLPTPPAKQPERWLDYLLVLFQPRVALAFASIIGLVIAGWYMLDTATSNPCQDLACLTSEEVHAYIDAHIDQFSTGTILEAGAISDLETYLELPSDAPDLEEALEDALQSIDTESLDLYIQ